MNKVKMTQEQFDAVRKDIGYGKGLYSLSNTWFENKSPVIGDMTPQQVAAAFLGADHCEIEPEYEELDHVQAAMAYAKGEAIQISDEDIEWSDLHHLAPIDVFRSDYGFGRKFRRLKL